MVSKCFAQLVRQYEQEAYRYSALKSYSVLQQLLDSVLEGTLDPDARPRVIDVRAQMESFESFFV